MGIKVIAYYTKNTPYEQEIKHLEESLKLFGIDYNFEGIDSRGDWTANCAYKPKFILDYLKKFPENNLIYLDADAVIVQEPKLIKELSEDVDIPVHYLNGKELLSGTIFLRNNKKVRHIVWEWVARQTNDVWDQKVLQSVLETFKETINIYNLPESYTKIFDRPGEQVIRHNQASRRLKNKLTVDSHLTKSKVLDSYDGVRVRWLCDGSFFLPRAKKHIINMLNTQFLKVNNENRWYTREQPSDLSVLRPIFTGKGCYFIGKGPSLDKIDERSFTNKDWPIICINDSIHKIETLALENPLLVMQQDFTLGNKCLPKKATLLISGQANRNYSDFNRKLVYSPYALGFNISTLTVKCAIVLASNMGCTEAVLYCFDSCLNNNVEYAEVIGYSSSKGGKKTRFLSHKASIMEIKSVPIRFENIV